MTNSSTCVNHKCIGYAVQISYPDFLKGFEERKEVLLKITALKIQAISL